MPDWAVPIVTWASFCFGAGIVAIWIPWLITRWNSGGPYPSEVTVVGAALIVAGGARV